MEYTYEDQTNGETRYYNGDPSASTSYNTPQRQEEQTTFLAPPPPPPQYTVPSTPTQSEDRAERRIQNRHAPYRRPHSSAGSGPRRASVAGPGRVDTRSVSYHGSGQNTPYTSPIVPLDASFPPPPPPQQERMMSRFPIIPPAPAPAPPPAPPPTPTKKPYLIRTDVLYTTPSFPPSSSEERDPNARTFIAIMELPGVLPSDLHITLNTNPLSHVRQVTVKGHCRPPAAFASLLEGEGEGKRERRYGEVVRTFPVASHTKVEDIKAHLEHGVLVLQIFVGPPLCDESEQVVRLSVA